MVTEVEKGLPDHSIASSICDKIETIVQGEQLHSWQEPMVTTL